MLTFKPLPLAIKHSALPAICLLISLLFFLLDNVISDALIYQHDAITQGELWRLITGHFFHTNVNHLLLNMSALVFLWALHGEHYTAKNYFSIVLTTGLLCSSALYLFNPDLNSYVGFSGILHGIFVWGAILDIKHKEKTGYLLLLGVLIKVIHEQIYGPGADIARIISANVAIDAHLYGFIGGLIFSLFYFYNTAKNHKHL